MNATPRASIALLGLMGLMGLLQVPAQAQGLADPTRPPASLQSGADGGIVNKPAHAARPAAAASTTASAPPLLQSVQIPSRGPANALIDSRLLQVGDSAGGEWRVAAIDAAGVLLKGGRGRELMLTLSSGVIRTSVSPLADAAPQATAGSAASKSK